jgi:hypothetical protein
VVEVYQRIETASTAPADAPTGPGTR